MLTAVTSTPGCRFLKAPHDFSASSFANVIGTLSRLERGADNTATAGGKGKNRGISAIRWADVIMGTCCAHCLSEKKGHCVGMRVEKKIWDV